MKEYKVLTIRQPWAHLIARGIKTIENRSWRTNYRGMILIHAGMTCEHEPALFARYDITPSELDYGYVIAQAYLADIVTEHRSKWFTGPYGWVLSQITPVKPIALRGRQSLFNASIVTPLLRQR